MPGIYSKEYDNERARLYRLSPEELNAYIIDKTAIANQADDLRRIATAILLGKSAGGRER